MRLCPLVLLAAAACSGSRSDSGAVLASATIGPEGGVLIVDGALQRGLRLTVPPGALLAPTTLVVRDVPPPPVPANAVALAPPGRTFRLEPSGLRLEERATLRAPYIVANVHGTAPGNVLLQEVRSGNTIDQRPDVVEVSTGFVETPIRFLAQYSVVVGPRAQSFASYWTVPGLVPLDDETTFEVGPVDAGSPFASPSSLRWRIRRTQVDDSLFFTGSQLVGRESAVGGWRETWAQGMPVWSRADEAPSAGITQAMQVQSLAGPATTVPGQITAFGVWSYAEPRTVAGETIHDVVMMRLTLAWQRADLGIGQREYLFWFTPNRGLLAFSQDGVVRARTGF